MSQANFSLLQKDSENQDIKLGFEAKIEELEKSSRTSRMMEVRGLESFVELQIDQIQNRQKD